MNMSECLCLLSGHSRLRRAFCPRKQCRWEVQSRSVSQQHRILLVRESGHRAVRPGHFSQVGRWCVCVCVCVLVSVENYMILYCVQEPTAWLQHSGNTHAHHQQQLHTHSSLRSVLEKWHKTTNHVEGKHAFTLLNLDVTKLFMQGVI